MDHNPILNSDLVLTIHHVASGVFDLLDVRLVACLTEYRGAGYKRLAKITGIPLPTVAVRMRKIRAVLRLK